jgi:hypothetical protein
MSRQQQQQVCMREEAAAFAAWLKADLHRRYDDPTDLPAELVQLVEKACAEG